MAGWIRRERTDAVRSGRRIWLTWRCADGLGAVRPSAGAHRPPAPARRERVVIVKGGIEPEETWIEIPERSRAEQGGDASAFPGTSGHLRSRIPRDPPILFRGTLPAAPAPRRPEPPVRAASRPRDRADPPRRAAAGCARPGPRLAGHRRPDRLAEAHKLLAPPCRAARGPPVVARGLEADQGGPELSGDGCPGAGPGVGGPEELFRVPGQVHRSVAGGTARRAAGGGVRTGEWTASAKKGGTVHVCGGAREIVRQTENHFHLITLWFGKAPSGASPRSPRAVLLITVNSSILEVSAGRETRREGDDAASS